MKVVIAIDSFKGSLSSIESGIAAKEGVLKVSKNAQVDIFPIADGGEGTVDALVEGLNGKLITVKVKNPLGEEIDAVYGIVNETTAVIEMSAAAGITLLSTEQLNPMNTTTYGVGEMINDAIKKGCRNFIIGIGGSATNDGGIGMLQALGYDLSDAAGNPVPFGAKGLALIEKISDENVIKELKDCRFNIACDVTNPLCGENGCSKIFAPQKGADEKQIEIMDNAMKRYAEITRKFNPKANENIAGTGAAGGLGFAFLSFLGGELKPGIDLILDLINIEQKIKNADIVVTGEGKLDSQSVMGKAPVGIARISKKYGKKVIAFAGAVLPDATACNSEGIDAFFPIVRTPCSLKDAMEKENAKRNLRDTAEQVFRLIVK